MSPKLKRAFEEEIRLSKAATLKGETALAFHYLEQAHILGQSHFTLHLISHWNMHKWGFRSWNPKEIFGQLLRIMAVFPANLFGFIPVGNTGGANVSAFKPMPIEEDLGQILRESSK